MTRSVFVAVILASALASARPPTGATSKVDHVIVVVDGQPAWYSQLEELYAANQITKPTFDQTQMAIDTLVDSILLENEAKRLRIEVTSEEIDAALDMIKQDNHLDDAGLDKVLADNHVTREFYRTELARQIREARLLSQEFAPYVRVTDDDLHKVYDQLKQANGASLGTFEQEHDRVRGMFVNGRASELQVAWLQKQRKTAHIERRL